MQCRISLLLTTLFILSLAGCGGGNAAVSGKITQKDGKIPEGATVVFTDEKNHRSASGNVNAEGEYRLTSDKPGDGAPPGIYAVTVFPPSAKDSSQAPPPRTFHQKYANPDASGITCEVKSGSNTFDFVLDPPAP